MFIAQAVTRCCHCSAAHDLAATTPRQRRLARQKARHREQQQKLRQQQGGAQQQQLQQLPTGGDGSSSGGGNGGDPTGAPPGSSRASSQLGCPHFEACSGCSLDKGLDMPPLLAEAQQFFSERCSWPGFQLHAGPAHGWRRRARLAVREGRNGEAAIGLFEEGSHTVTPIPSCVVHHPAINAALSLVQQAVAACGVQPYLEAEGSGHLRYLQLTVVEPPCSSSSSTGEASLPPLPATPDAAAAGGASPASSTSWTCAATVQLVLVWNGHGPDEPGSSTTEQQQQQQSQLSQLAERLWQMGQQHSGGSTDGVFHSIWANYQPSQTNTILGSSWQLLHGEEWAWARLGGADICFGPGSFMQANFGAMESALVAMQQLVPRGSSVVDLHAGVGTIGLSLAATRQPRWVRFVEVNGQGLQPFQQSAARLQPRQQAKGSSSSSGNSADISSKAAAPALEYHVATAGSDPGRWCAGADVVVCDPPRKGLEPQLLRWLCSPAPATASVQRLLYLSCGFAAFQRDCGELLGSGRWRLRHAESFLFFPGADHIETLAVFELACPADATTC